MYDFKRIAEEELARQKGLLLESEHILKGAPNGTLRCRKRKHKNSFYLYTNENGVSKEENINLDTQLISRLVKKRIAQLTLKNAKINIALLEEFLDKYKASEPTDIIKLLPEGYVNALKTEALSEIQKWAAEQSKQYFYDPKVHKHETISGIKVRSKSEALIANTLTYYGIPFYYEKPLSHEGFDGRSFYPDFTIVLPTGELILWEHLGMLDNLNYCIHNAEKINFYQKQSYMIGINLIITQDDSNGGCSSAYIDKLVREMLLPYFS